MTIEEGKASIRQWSMVNGRIEHLDFRAIGLSLRSIF